ITGMGTVAPADSMRFDMRLRVEPVSLAVASAFTGEQELRGALVGHGHLSGTPRRFEARADLQHLAQRDDTAGVRPTGRLEAHGEVDLSRDTIGYVATIQTRGVDLRAVMPVLPATALTGVTAI